MNPIFFLGGFYVTQWQSSSKPASYLSLLCVAKEKGKEKLLLP
jgi:hypothetical protein